MEQVNKVEAIKGILNEASPAEPVQSDSEDSGDAVPAQVDGGDDSRSESMDSEEPNDLQSVEDDSEAAPGADTDDDLESGVTLSELAAKINLSPADLYDVEVPLGKGEVMTLGELKDQAKEMGSVVDMRDKVTAEREDHELAVMRTRSEINGILRAIPEDIRAQVVEAGRAFTSGWEKEQRQAVSEAIPEWENPDVLAKDRDMIVSVGAEYGFSKPEMEYTQDARTLRMLRDFTRLRGEIEGMRAAAKVVRAKPGAPGKQNQRTLTKRKLAAALGEARASKDVGVKRDAIKQLLGRQNHGNS